MNAVIADEDLLSRSAPTNLLKRSCIICSRHIQDANWPQNAGVARNRPARCGQIRMPHSNNKLPVWDLDKCVRPVLVCWATQCLLPIKTVSMLSCYLEDAGDIFTARGRADAIEVFSLFFIAAISGCAAEVLTVCSPALRHDIHQTVSASASIRLDLFGGDVASVRSSCEEVYVWVHCCHSATHSKFAVLEELLLTASLVGNK